MRYAANLGVDEWGTDDQRHRGDGQLYQQRRGTMGTAEEQHHLGTGPDSGLYLLFIHIIVNGKDVDV